MAAVSATAHPTVLSNTCVSRPLSAHTSFSVRPAAGGSEWGLETPAPNCTLQGLPALRTVKVSCSAKDEQKVRSGTPAVASGLAASALAVTQPAFALVDERLNTEGTGQALGVSNPLLVWILLGVATLVWALFFSYVSSLKEDDDSGLAL